MREKGHWLYILELQGFIFFGTANRLLERVRQRINAQGLSAPRFVVMDFRQVCGLDASAVLSFVKMKQLAQAQDIVLVFTHLSPKMQRQLEREVFQDEDRAVWRTYPDLDHGVEWCEEQMIQVLESVGFRAKPKGIMQQLEESLPKTGRFINLLDCLAPEDDEQQQVSLPESINLASLTEYMERKDVDEGYYLIRQGDDQKGIYFIEAGQATAQLEYEHGRTVRLRVMGAGTVVGEVGLYSGGKASASVVTNQPSTIYHLSVDSLRQMEATAPEAAAAFHKFIAQLLSERLLSTTGTMQALLE